MIHLIVAYAKNRIIGKNGKIPWNIPGEQSRFRELTTGHVVIMGRRTYEEIGHPLPGRYLIVVSRTKQYSDENLTSATSFQEAVGMAEQVAEQTKWHGPVFIAGGAGIYERALPIVDKMYITEIDMEVEGDTVFPAFAPEEYHRIEEETVYGEPTYHYVIYQRKSR